MIKLRRVYERYEITDGKRILVDRLWPRGIRRTSPNVDIWIEDVAPSTELRKWYAHDPKKWISFKKKYMRELENNDSIEKLVEIISSTDPVTLVYAASDAKHNNAVVLLEFLRRKLRGSGLV